MCYSNVTDRDLMGQIATKLNDYRNPPQGGMSIDHVNRWINQFELTDRRFVLGKVRISRSFLPKLTR